MTAVLCLFIIEWIAINVMQYHCVCRGEVDSLSPSPSRQEEHKNFRVCIVFVDETNPREAERVELDLFRQAASYLNLFSCSRLEKKTFGTKKKTNKQKKNHKCSVCIFTLMLTCGSFKMWKQWILKCTAWKIGQLHFITCKVTVRTVSSKYQIWKTNLNWVQCKQSDMR